MLAMPAPAAFVWHRPDCIARTVAHEGQNYGLIWDLYGASEKIRLVLVDLDDPSEALTATVDLDWICRDDEVLLRDEALYRSLAAAGVVSPRRLPLAGAGATVLAQLAPAALEEAERHLSALR